MSLSELENIHVDLVVSCANRGDVTFEQLTLLEAISQARTVRSNVPFYSMITPSNFISDWTTVIVFYERDRLYQKTKSPIKIHPTFVRKIDKMFPSGRNERLVLRKNTDRGVGSYLYVVPANTPEQFVIIYRHNGKKIKYGGVSLSGVTIMDIPSLMSTVGL